MWTAVPAQIALAVVVLVVLAVVSIHDRLVALRNRAEERWAQIDVQLTRRHDLIPKLVETVKGYAGHERRVLTCVTEARAAAVSAGSVGSRHRSRGC